MKLQNVILASCFIISLLCDVTVRSHASSSIPSLLGVAPQDENYYKVGLSSSTGTIECKDGSKKFNTSQLNDDYCDCLDGSDEPGTSACPNGSFYFKNAVNAPLFLYSSRVNDGICDCCDGSGEYDGKIKCPSTCWEAGKVARQKLKKIATYQEGVTICNREIEQAKLNITKEEAELSKLEDEEKVLKGLVEQLNECKEQIEKAEEKERLQKEKEEKERMEAEHSKDKETNNDEKSETIQNIENDVHDKIETGHQPPQDSAEDHLETDIQSELNDHPIDNGLPDDESNPEQSGEDSTNDGKADTDNENQDKNAVSLSREELGRRIASRWTGEKIEEQTQADASLNEDEQNYNDTLNEASDEEYKGYDSSQDDEHTYDDDENGDHVDDFQAKDNYDATSPHLHDSDDELDLSDITGSSSPSWLERIQQTVKRIISAANIFQTPVNISDAAHVRKEYDESSAMLSKIQSKISSLTKKLKQDFGPEKEFYSFYGQCFEIMHNKYVYKVCPSKQATQEEGHSITRLGELG